MSFTNSTKRRVDKKNKKQPGSCQKLVDGDMEHVVQGQLAKRHLIKYQWRSVAIFESLQVLPCVDSSKSLKTPNYDDH